MKRPSSMFGRLLLRDFMGGTIKEWVGVLMFTFPYHIRSPRTPVSVQRRTVSTEIVPLGCIDSSVSSV